MKTIISMIIITLVVAGINLASKGINTVQTAKSTTLFQLIEAGK